MTRTLQRESESTRTAPRRRSGADGRNLALLWAGQFVNTAGLMMLVPIMPFYLEEMGTSGTAQTQTWAGVAIAAPALALTVATPLWGRLGDRIGRKWMVVRALLGLAGAMAVMAAATTPLVLVAGRLLQGTFGGVVEAAAAFAGSTGSDKKRGSALGKSFSATAAGALAGPIAGGLFVGAGGLRQLMLVIAAAAVVLSLGCAVGLQEPGRRQARAGQRDSTPERERPSVLRVPSAIPLALASIAAYFGIYGLISVFAEHVRAGVSDPMTASLWVGVLHSVMWGASLAGSFWWGKHNDRAVRPVRTFAIAAGGCAVSIAALGLPLDPLVLIPLRLVQGFCFAALAQSLYLHFSRHAPEENKSSFVSTANSFLLIGQSAGPLLAGPLVSVMPVAAAVLVMAIACAVAGLLAMGPAHRENHSPEIIVPDENDGERTTRLPITGWLEQPDRDANRSGGVGVASFRGWRVAPERMRALAGRYATPWDQCASAWDGSADEAAAVLRSWQHGGALVHETTPAVYAYEQTGPRGSQRGVLAAVHLDSQLLPHQEVVPSRAHGIARVMDVAQLNLDPLLLGYPGNGRTTALLNAVTRHNPTSDVLGSDGQRHRLWRITDQAAHADIADELGQVPVFLADGHHRWVAARQHRRCLHAAGHGPGPWDHISALLVDVRRSPMTLGPIHRVLPYLNPRAALDAAATRFGVTRLRGDLTDWLRALRQSTRHGIAFAVVTGHEAFLLTAPNRPFLADVLRRVPAPLREVQLTVLHTALIEALWTVPDSPEDIHYEASPTEAVRQVREFGGVAVLVAPPRQADLQNAAAAGLRLPRKATSFGPKPHPGLVLRLLDEH
jgi:MFS family permease/uncharacterized protein (DUF1015 family)